MMKFILNNKDKVIISGFLQHNIFFVLMGLVISFLLLDNLDSDADFRAIQLFMGLFIFFYVIHVGLAVSDKYSKRISGKNAFLFFQHDVTIGSLAWVPIGIGLAFGVSLIISNANLPQTESAFYSIFLSGLIMMLIFIRTKAFLIPTLIHGGFNSLVIIFSSPSVGFQLLSTNIPIPEIGLQLGTLSRLATESISQFFVVAPAEEMLKMGGITFWLLLGKGKFDPKSWQFYVGAFVTVGWWSSLHLLNAI
jgi:hypothetical protein